MNEGLASELGLYQARYDDCGNCSGRLTGSKRSLRRISGESRIRRLPPITGRWGLSNSRLHQPGHPAKTQPRLLPRKEVDSEARTHGPKGAMDFHGFAVSLKRYPDTKRGFAAAWIVLRDLIHFFHFPQR